ncbi:MAG: VRR-NUC domain-containing protein [Deltaproteobacteria bacterium]|nr:VRR-NUC domain-containing protein [Deltaproteobacteria bacterium]
MRWTREQLEDYLTRRRQSPADDHEADPGPESRLQAKCERWLRDRGYPYIHDRSRGRNRPGIPDLICFLPAGRVVLIELKSKRGRLTPDQVKMRQALMYLGHEIYEVRSYKRFVEIMLSCPPGKSKRKGGEK